MVRTGKALGVPHLPMRSDKAGTCLEGAGQGGNLSFLSLNPASFHCGFLNQGFSSHVLL